MSWAPGTPVLLETERFVLRSLRAQDATARYVSWLEDEEVMRFVNARFAEHDLASVGAFIARHDDRTSFLLGIFERGTGRHIGNYEVEVHPHHRHCHAGILIGERTRWGEGVVSEVWGTALRFLFREVGVEKVCGECYASNRAALFNYQAFGFEMEGILRSHVVLDDGRDDVVRFALSRAAWDARDGAST